VPSDTAAELDSKDNIHTTKDDDAKLLFGNGRLDRWLSARQTLHKRTKSLTLDHWLLPNKTPAASLLKKSPLVARTQVASLGNSPSKHSKSPGKLERSPGKPRQKSSAINVKSESSDQPQSPSTDIRRFFHSQGLPRKPLSKSDSGTENELDDDVTVIDLVVADSPPEVKSEHHSEAVGQVRSSHELVAAVPEPAAKSSSCQLSSSDGPVKTMRSLEWWATSRTKSSTRRGPFKRSLGRVHFLNEVRFMLPPQ